MDAKIFHNTLRQITEKIAKKHRNNDDYTHPFQCLVGAVGEASLCNIVGKAFLQLIPMFRFGYFCGTFIGVKKCMQKGNNQRKVQHTKYDAKQRGEHVGNRKFFDRLSVRKKSKLSLN